MFSFLICQKPVHLIIELLINAVPDPMAILIEIKSEKFVENRSVNNIPIAKPK